MHLTITHQRHPGRRGTDMIFGALDDAGNTATVAVNRRLGVALLDEILDHGPVCIAVEPVTEPRVAGKAERVARVQRAAEAVFGPNPYGKAS